MSLEIIRLRVLIYDTLKIMNSIFLKFLVFIGCFVFVNSVQAEDFIFDKLKNTEEPYAEFSPQTLKNIDSVWIVFQKDCDTCHKVLKESSCYAKKNKVQVIALGLYETPENLLKDARKTGFKGPVLISDEKVDEKMGLDVTPTTFVMHKNKLHKRFDAYVSCAEIKKALKPKKS